MPAFCIHTHTLTRALDEALEIGKTNAISSIFVEKEKCITATHILNVSEDEKATQAWGENIMIACTIFENTTHNIRKYYMQQKLLLPSSPKAPDRDSAHTHDGRPI